jgi:hypothetical protein
LDLNASLQEVAGIVSKGTYLSTVAGESLEGTLPVYFISLTEYPDVKPCFTKSDCVIEALGWLFMKFLAS